MDMLSSQINSPQQYTDTSYYIASCIIKKLLLFKFLKYFKFLIIVNKQTVNKILSNVSNKIVKIR